MRKLILLFLIVYCSAQVSQKGLSEQGVKISGNPPAIPIQVQTASVPNGTQGTAYSTTLSAIGGVGAYSGWTVSVGTLPAGLTLSAATGTISGTPTTPGTSSFSVTVHDTVPTTSPAKPLSITIVASGGCGPPAFPCARTDFNCPNGIGSSNCFVTPPSFGPALTGGNTNYVDPYFGANGLHITDVNFDASKTCPNLIVGCPNYVVVTSGSTEENLFNTDDSKIWIQHSGTRGYSVDIATPGTTSGTVNTSGTVVTWTAGTNFNFAWSPYGSGGIGITINGSNFTIAHVDNPRQLTLTASAGTQTGVAYSVTVTTLKSARTFNNGPGTGFFVVGSGSWSRSDRCKMIILEGTHLDQYDLCQSTSPGTIPSTTCTGVPYPLGGSVITVTNPCVVFDFANTNLWGYDNTKCLGAGYTQTGWSAFGGISKFPPDVYYEAAFSTGTGQGTGRDVVAYVVGQGCSHIDTQAWTVTGDFGTNGAVSSPPVAFLEHNTKIFLNGTTQWAVVEPQPGTCVGTCPAGPFFWKVGTGNFYNSIVPTPGGPGMGGGHKCEGDHTMVNAFSSPILNYASRSVVANSFLTTGINLIPSGTTTTPPTCYLNVAGGPVDQCYPPGSGGHNLVVPIADNHCGYNDADVNDTIPFTDAISDSGQWYCPPGSPYCSGYPAAWYQEIRMVQASADGSGNYGKVYREASCFNSGQSPNFDAVQCTLAISQTGKFTIFTSDGNCTLGDVNGGTAPIGCYPNWRKSTTYAGGARIFPFSQNTCDYAFSTTGGTTAATQSIYTTAPCSTGSAAKVATAGTAVTWIAGTKFNTQWVGPIVINGVTYTIASVADTTHLTLTTSAGTQGSTTPPVSGVFYSVTGVGNYVVTDGTATFTSLGSTTQMSQVFLVQLR